MANNRLYLKAKDGSRLLLAKGWGDRWEAHTSADLLANWINTHVPYESDFDTPTTLKIESEADPQFGVE